MHTAEVNYSCSVSSVTGEARIKTATGHQFAPTRAAGGTSTRPSAAACARESRRRGSPGDARSRVRGGVVGGSPEVGTTRTASGPADEGTRQMGSILAGEYRLAMETNEMPAHCTSRMDLGNTSAKRKESGTPGHGARFRLHGVLGRGRSLETESS